MRVVVLYESLTGNTRRAAEAVGEELAAAGHEVRVDSVVALDHQALARADLVVVGGWTDGVFLFGQRPGRAYRLRSLPPLDGKRAVVFCTFALDPGKTLEKLSAIVEERGATVLGGMTIRRDRIEEGARDLVARLLAAVSA